MAPLSANDQNLIDYAYYGDLNKVRDLLHAGANVNAQNEYAETALWMASQDGHVEVVRALLQHDKVNVNLQRNTDGVTALWMASQDGHVEVVRALLQHDKVNVNLQHTDGVTALYIASQKGHVEVVRALLQHDKMDVNLQRNTGATALYIASCNGHVEVVRALLQHDKVDVNLQRNTGETALYIASCNGHVEVVRALLQHDTVDVNLQRNTGETALYMASQEGHVEVVRALLQHDTVDVNLQRNIGGVTALWIAKRRGNKEVVGCLKEYLSPNQHLIRAARAGQLKEVRTLLLDGTINNSTKKSGFTASVWTSLKGRTSERANINAVDDCGETALIAASTNGHVAIVIELLNYENVNLNLQRHTDGATALYMASRNGHVQVIRTLLQHDNVDVNLYCYTGGTALWMASQKGHVEVVRVLLHHGKVDVNLQDNDGVTALWQASQNGHSRVVRALLEHNQVDVNQQASNGLTALDVARASRHVDIASLLERHVAGVSASPQSDNPPPESNNNNDDASIHDDAMIQEDRTKLSNMMSNTSMTRDPIELSHRYIQSCITDHKLGSGAFGDVFLAHDRHLPKKCVVKKIKLDHSDEDIINEIRNTFRKELSTLKKFHHPNIIVLYGYNLNIDVTDQFLVYEYASNGSLDGFFRDDGNRARLEADTRLSIMFGLVRAVHFLHTGGCQGWKVFHRDIKSANICLAEDFSARLIDCGLAKFVPDDNSNMTQGSVTPSLRSTNRGPAFGTPGYMCPEYVKKKSRGRPCPYIAEYDVYSIGVVMVELILGCLTGGQSMRNGTQFDDVFELYVLDDRDRLIVDGWEKLMHDADPCIIWNSKSLELVCKAAIQCMAPFSDERLSTKDLLDELSYAIRLKTNPGFQHPEAGSAVDSGPYCDACHNYRTAIKCSEGHALCVSCIENKLAHGCEGQLSCLIVSCSSQPIQDEDLFGRISVDAYNRYKEKRDVQFMLKECFRQLNVGIRSQFDDLRSDLRSDVHSVKHVVDESNEMLKQQQEMLKNVAKGLDRSLAALSLLAAKQIMECPNLVWVTPISVETKDWSNPQDWIRNASKRKYKVVFLCAHSGEPGHDPFEIEVPRAWMVKIAPWLKLCLLVITGIANAQGLPFPTPNISRLEQCRRMKSFLNSLVRKDANPVLSRCETLLESGTMTIDTFQDGQVTELVGEAFKWIAEKAQKEKQWKPPQMFPVFDRNGSLIWVKGEFKNRYES